MRSTSSPVRRLHRGDFQGNPVESGFSYIRYADKATLSRQYAPQRMNALNSTIAFWEKVVRNIAGSGEGGH